MPHPSERRRGLLVGHGSIGRHHLTVLSARYPHLVVVDTSEVALEGARDAAPEAIVVTDLDAPELLGWSWADTTAVVATLGPSHVGLVDDLVGRGVNRILVEKPLATSVADAHHVVELAATGAVRIGVHLHYRYSGVVDSLCNLASNALLGEPQQIVVHGGARGLVTNGIHYLDLAAALFGGFPERVLSTATGEAINPRSSDLAFFGGTAVWSFGRGRELVMSFPNTSTLYESVDIYYRDGIIELSVLLDAVVRRRPASADITPMPITKSGTASEVVFQGPLPDVRPLGEATSRILDEMEGDGAARLSLSDTALGVSAIVGALQSGRDGHVVELPIDPNSPAGKTEWPIS